VNIIVTTPKGEIKNAKKEAEFCIKNRGGFYFRKLSKKPKKLNVGDRIYYIEDGFIRGFSLVFEIKNSRMKCEVMKKEWGDGWYIIMKAEDWKWIRIIPMKGFQGYHYVDNLEVEIIGNWLDKKPLTVVEARKIALDVLKNAEKERRLFSKKELNH
jgi:hypothetical protein